MQSSSILGQRLQAFQPATVQRPRQQQLQVVAKDSRIGKRPVPVPDKVAVTLDGQTVKVKVRRRAA
jgi:large subunit ribosomal protein L6